VDSERELEVIRDEMEQTRTSLADKLGALESQVRETVSTASETVTSTVEGVKEVVSGVSDTVSTVTETFNISKHIEQHPWAAMGIALAAGYVVSRLLGGSSQPSYGPPPGWQPQQPPTPTSQTSVPSMGNVMGQASDQAPSHRGGQERPQRQEQPPQQQGPGIMAQAAALLPALSSFVPDIGSRVSAFLPSLDQLTPEIEKLGNTVAEGLGQLAVGGVMCVVRELAVDALPDSWKGEIVKIIDDATEQLGGKPQQLDGQEKHGQNGRQQHQGQEGQKGHEKQGGSKEGHDKQGAQQGRRELAGKS